MFLKNITLRSEGHRITLRRFCPNGDWSPWALLPVLPRTTGSTGGAAPALMVLLPGWLNFKIFAAAQQLAVSAHKR